MLSVLAMGSSWVGLKEVLTASTKANVRLRAENARLLRWNHLLRDGLRQVAKHGHVSACEECAQAATAAERGTDVLA